MISINPLNNETYEIPSVLDDSKRINKFLGDNPNKEVVVVQGLGFVGAVMSLVCANALKKDYNVIGVDLPKKDSYWKIKSINEGLFPVIASDPKIEEYYQLCRKKGNLLATYDEFAYSKADTIIVDINLDVQKNSSNNGDLESFDVNMNSFKKAINLIANNCKEDVLILIETTVPPGTTELVVKPIIEKGLLNRGLGIQKYCLGHSYERVMPGPNYIDSIQNFYRVYSGINNSSSKKVRSFLETIISTDKYPLTMLGNTNATEMAKVLENSFRAMNISFIVEWSRFAEEANVNLYEVIDSIRMRPTHNNMMYPGIGVGGYCLTKDPLLASWAKQNHFGSADNLNQSEKGVKINDKMPLYAFKYMKKAFNIKSLNNKKILFLGVSYRSDVGDTRFSPVELFYNCCKNEGAEIILHDPYVLYWEELGLSVSQDLNKVLINDLDILIITTSHSLYFNSNKFLEIILNKNKMMIYDSLGIISESNIKKLKAKHSVKILGRGDI